MEALIKMVSEKTGISEAQASTAVQTVITFLKDKMPAGIGGQVESFIKGGAGPIGGIAIASRTKWVACLANNLFTQYQGGR